MLVCYNYRPNTTRAPERSIRCAVRCDELSVASGFRVWATGGGGGGVVGGGGGGGVLTSSINL